MQIKRNNFAQKFNWETLTLVQLCCIEIHYATIVILLPFVRTPPLTYWRAKKTKWRKKNGVVRDVEINASPHFNKIATKNS